MLLLVRHGESTANADALLVGRCDAALTDLGRRQAQEIARALGPVQHVVSSPLRRALETARTIAGDQPVRVDDRFIEVDYGEYDGQPIGHVPADVWRHWRADPEFRPPGGEALADVRRRVEPALLELFAVDGAGARRPDCDVVVVSHVSPIKAAVGWALGAAEPLDTRLHLGTGSVTRIGWGTGVPLLEGFNQTFDDALGRPRAGADAGAGGVAGAEPAPTRRLRSRSWRAARPGTEGSAPARGG